MGCSHNCDSCSSHCGGEKSLKVAANPAASVKKVIGVVSGKGGVGKSLLTSMMAVGMTRKGYSCGVLDADITGPSIPKTFGVRSARGLRGRHSSGTQRRRCTDDLDQSGTAA